MKQTVTITSAGSGDAWDSAPRPPYTLQCRIQEGVRLVRNIHGQEVASAAQIYFDKLADITLSDSIAYEDENGLTRKYAPISIEVKRSISGAPLLTVVNV